MHVESQDHELLVIALDEGEQAELQELKDEAENFHSDDQLYSFFEHLIGNSELQWIDPSDTGDLTDAPMLGVLGEESDQNTGPYGAVCCGHWDGKDRYEPIVYRWAFMDYAIKSVLETLLNDGKATFQG